VPARKLPKIPKRNAAGHSPRLERRPSSEFKLTAEERKLLKDPDWMDEDEADAILALRKLKHLKDSDFTDLRDYIRSRGRDIQD
jgi:hypothetical protein